MKAILLAAGYGTRLRPITDTTPKCLIPIGREPLLSIWLENIVRSSVSEVIVNTHYLHELVESHVRNSKFSKYVTISHETNLLGTAGTVIANRDFIGDDDCLLIHADNFTNTDLSKLIELHNSRPVVCEMSMLTFRTTTPESCGIVEIDKDNIVCEFYEKSSQDHGDLASGAVYALSNQLLRQLKSEKDFSTEVIPHLMGKILAVESDGFFVDIGTPASLQYAEELAREERVRS